MNRNIETFISCESDFERANTVLFGAPFDSTTSFRPGTRFASHAIRSDSFGIETYSPYQCKDLCDTNIFDFGDLELCIGNSQKALEQIENMVSEILNAGKISAMIGGEHLVTLGAVRAAVKKYPSLNIIHFDAHCDLRDNYLGEKFSHATVMRRCYELVGDGRIFQFGIRSGDKTEFDFSNEGHVNTVKFDFHNIDKTVEMLKGKPVYFTLDLDVLDPSVFPGTGTPEAGGVSFLQLLEAVLKLKELNIVAFDIDELSPVYDQSGVSTAVSCKILREILIMLNCAKLYKN